MNTGMIGAIISGAIWPIFAVVFSQISAVMLELDKSKANFWVCMFVVLGAFAAVGNFAMRFCLGVSGERLTKRCVCVCVSAVACVCMPRRARCLGMMLVRSTLAVLVARLNICMVTNARVLPCRVRLLCFSAIMYQPIPWFDQRENSVGALSVGLATDASEVWRCPLPPLSAFGDVFVMSCIAHLQPFCS